MNTILIVLIVIVIYLIHTTSPGKENFDINPKKSGYTNNNNYWDPHRRECDRIYSIEDCNSSYWRTMCSDKCNLLQKEKDNNKKNF